MQVRLLLRALTLLVLGVWDMAVYIPHGGWALLLSAVALIVVGGAEAWKALC